METKSKIVKAARICAIVSKVLYIVAIAACVTFVVLAITLPLNHVVQSMTDGETAVVFATLAVYAFICVGLLWNIEGVFKAIAAEGSPFGERVSHYLKKVAVFVIVLSIVPAILGTAVVRAVNAETELAFPIDLGGVIAGAVLFLVGLFFNYGKELQTKDDQTL